MKECKKCKNMSNIEDEKNARTKGLSQGRINPSFCSVCCQGVMSKGMKNLNFSPKGPTTFEIF